jgi:hypothetical protein
LQLVRISHLKKSSLSSFQAPSFHPVHHSVQGFDQGNIRKESRTVTLNEIQSYGFCQRASWLMTAITSPHLIETEWIEGFRLKKKSGPPLNLPKVFHLVFISCALKTRMGPHSSVPPLFTKAKPVKLSR